MATLAHFLSLANGSAPSPRSLPFKVSEQKSALTRPRRAKKARPVEDLEPATGSG